MTLFFDIKFYIIWVLSQKNKDRVPAIQSGAFPKSRTFIFLCPERAIHTSPGHRPG